MYCLHVLKYHTVSSKYVQLILLNLIATQKYRSVYLHLRYLCSYGQSTVGYFPLNFKFLLGHSSSSFIGKSQCPAMRTTMPHKRPWGKRTPGFV